MQSAMFFMHAAFASLYFVHQSPTIFEPSSIFDWNSASVLVASSSLISPLFTFSLNAVKLAAAESHWGLALAIVFMISSNAFISFLQGTINESILPFMCSQQLMPSPEQLFSQVASAVFTESPSAITFTDIWFQE